MKRIAAVVAIFLVLSAAVAAYKGSESKDGGDQGGLVGGSGGGVSLSYPSSGSYELRVGRKTSGQSIAAQDTSGGEPEELASDEVALSAGADPQGVPIAAGPAASVPGLPSKVIKTASVEIKVSEGRFQVQFSKATVLAETLGGFVSSSNVSETSGKISSGTLTIRVPAVKFQTAITRLKLLGKVTAEEQSGQDVTREFIDLEARLRHAKAQEAFFLKLLDQSKTIADLVQVQQQLANIQLQIEELQGHLQFLKDQTDLATITARIYEPGARPGPPRELGKAWRRAADGFLSVISGVIVGAGYVLPLALLAAIIAVAYRGMLRSRRKGEGEESE